MACSKAQFLPTQSQTWYICHGMLLSISNKHLDLFRNKVQLGWQAFPKLILPQSHLPQPPNHLILEFLSFWSPLVVRDPWVMADNLRISRPVCSISILLRELGDISLPELNCHNCRGAAFVSYLVISAPSSDSVPDMSTSKLDLRVFTHFDLLDLEIRRYGYDQYKELGSVLYPSDPARIS
jgi:hypothetical protein